MTEASSMIAFPSLRPLAARVPTVKAIQIHSHVQRWSGQRKSRGVRALATSAAWVVPFLSLLQRRSRLCHYKSPAARLTEHCAVSSTTSHERKRARAQGVRDDVQRRWTSGKYMGDWRDGLHPKSIATIAFMYFACLAPTIAFGQLTGIMTNGTLSVQHFLASSALCGVCYAFFAGQPMTMVGPTGLTFAYVGAFYDLCVHNNWPFLSLYAWTGLWCSFFLALLACGGACRLLVFVTQFTDDIFNGLIVITYLITACQHIVAPFFAAGADKTLPFINASLALGTFVIAGICHITRSSRYLGQRTRQFLADFGPAVAIGGATVAARSSLVADLAHVDGLMVPVNLDLGRPLLLPLWPAAGVPLWVPLASLPPAVLLTVSFFLDQNITSRVVNKPSFGLRKGAAYHLDLLVVSAIVAACSILGLPWMVGSTVQSLNHVRAMTIYGGGKDESSAVVSGVIETRFTGVMVSSLIGASFLLLPLLRCVPASAINGLFLYLGISMMRGNAFFQRVRFLLYDPKADGLNNVRPVVAHSFTVLQAICLVFLWRMRSAPSVALGFPLGILLLIAIRMFLAPRLFQEQDLIRLDEALPERCGL